MRRRPLRWILVGIVLAVGLYFVLDVIALQYLESRGAAELATTLTAEEAKIDLGDIPFLPGFVTGRLSRAEITVRGASGSGGFRVQSLNARMSDLRFSWREMFALSRSVFSTRTRLAMSEPIGLVEIGQTDLEDFLQRHIPDVGTVGISSAGVEVRFLEKRLKTGIEPTPDDLTEPARYLPRVRDRRIVLSLIGMAQVPDRFEPSARRVEQVIDLPAIPEGLRSDVRLGEGVITVEASGREAELEIGEGEE
jgi:hypothetical protein